jgi:hypothetical protein
MTDRSRFAINRDRQRGGPPRVVQKCGEGLGACRRHQLAGENPLHCPLCAPWWKAHQHRMYVQRKARQKG